MFHIILLSNCTKKILFNFLTEFNGYKLLLMILMKHISHTVIPYCIDYVIFIIYWKQERVLCFEFEILLTRTSISLEYYTNQ